MVRKVRTQLVVIQGVGIIFLHSSSWPFSLLEHLGPIKPKPLEDAVVQAADLFESPPGD